MSNMKFLVFTMFAIIVLMSCTDDYDKDFETDIFYNNPAYPTEIDSLRILAIGNSFTLDATYYLDQIVKSACIDENRLCIYESFLESATFETWSSFFNSKSSTTIERKCGNIVMNARGTLEQILNQDWDVIVVQQASSCSYQWNSYKYMGDFLKQIVNSVSPSKRVCIAFQLVWSHTKKEMPKVLNGNITCCRRMIDKFGIDVVIPTGVAIQLARGTSLNDKKYLTIDNWHLNTGIGRYIASCTWFEKLIAPVFGVTILGNKADPEGNYSEADVALAQKCAITANENPFNYNIIVK